MKISKIKYAYKDEFGIFHIAFDDGSKLKIVHLDDDSAWILYQALDIRLDDIDAPA